MLRQLGILGIVMAMGGLVACSSARSMPFSDWVAGVRNEAIQQGIPPAVATEALADIRYDEKVVELDQRQPEDKATFSQYKAKVVNAKRIARGRALLAEHRAVLETISRQYRVQPQYIIALWGIETDFGAHQGNYNILQSLATLAYEGRREAFFKGELIKAMRMMATYHIPASELKGSWAGAMGNCQFMPSSYLNFAVDWDKNGHPDIWNSTDDTFASIANYLQKSGWDESQGWGEAVPETATGDDLVTPGEEEEGRYRVTSNYNVLLKWNRSRLFAVSVGLLADEIAK